MTKLKIVLLLMCFIAEINATEYSVSVDGNGVMRRDDTKAAVSFYGVNYTMPFAHAYRAMGYLEKDRKAAIDRDVYHFSRLGFNAFRIHIWDVEITDGVGNLQGNDHLDLLDYLITQLEKRNIRIILTAQTNFGNGYPERNINTGAYSYLYDKCKVHDDKQAIKAQTRYVKSLAKHVNRYNGKSYSDDKSIIAFEINNEPCHSGKEAEVKSYVNTMVKAFRSGGWKKPLFYNVSHNMYVTQAFFDADVEGTTYQWYPIGLVAGHERKGNFLPQVDNYGITFSGVRNFANKAKAIYEFDPADILYSYMYPAMVRTFRGAGFQWITQFAYDPIDMAWANTEYQTHFLNLAYTPNKAISMKIAAQVAQEVQMGEKFGSYPNDTIFGNFRVSYKQNLSEYNTENKFYYSNSTNTLPKNINRLENVVGCGTSSVVSYEGTGAYFIDKIDSSTWRLEVMPDVALVTDPFAKPSLKRKVGKIVYKEQPMTINLPLFNGGFKYKAVDAGNSRSGQTATNTLNVYPGVYLLSTSQVELAKYDATSKYGEIAMGEYVAPEKENVENVVLHSARKCLERGNELELNAKVFGSELPDSVVVYPSTVSMWIDNNKTYKMNHTHGYDYELTIPASELEGTFSYNIVTFNDGKPTTFPQGEEGTPLSWDFSDYKYYSTMIVGENSPIVLLSADNMISGIDVMSVPEGANVRYHIEKAEPITYNYLAVSIDASVMNSRLFVRKYIGDILAERSGLSAKKRLFVKLCNNVEGLDRINVSLISNEGNTYSSSLSIDGEGIYEIDMNALALQPVTTLLPAPYPTFLSQEFKVTGHKPIQLNDIEQIEFSTEKLKGQARLGIVGAWIE